MNLMSALKRPWRMAVCVLALGGTVWAQQAPGDGGATLSAPATSDSVKYLTGGAGDEERSQLMSQWKEFPLLIVFSADGGAYAVADSVRVTNALGAVLLDVAQAGPLLMLNLPPGEYHVQARVGGAAQERSVHMGAQTQRLDWRV